MSQQVEELVDQGRYEEAAALAEDEGDFSRAAELYAKVWRFAEAAACASNAGNLNLALRNALRARDDSLVTPLVARCREAGEDERKRALVLLQEYKEHDKAARLAEAGGDWALAASFYQDAFLPVQAARMWRKAGDNRKAGHALERALGHLDEGPEKLEAHLALGELMVEVRQLADSIYHLQKAAAHDKLAGRAHRLLVSAFAGQDMREAARQSLRKLRVIDPDTPADLDEYLRTRRKALPPKKKERQAPRMVGGRYRLEELLGHGASGRVHRAVDEVSGTEVAIKILAATAGRGGEAFARFEREAKLAKSLHHPNLVEVFDVSPDQGYLVMEYLPGGSLKNRMSKASAPAAVRRLGLELLAGLELAHRRGVIHRDIKPANIFFDARGIAKLGDFGVAHLLDLGQTQTGGLIGTLAYMSPEQITGAPLTIAADFYSVGITLYECLCGRLPFQGPDFVAQHLADIPPKASELSECSRSWDGLFESLLAKSPAERFDSIDRFRKELQRLSVESQSAPIALPSYSSGDASERKRRTSIPIPTSSDSGDRLQFETPIGTTQYSQLYRAVDSVLNRSVIVEEFFSPLSEEQEARLYALARGGGPYMQRALSYEKGRKKIVFEAPAGAPLSQLSTSLSPRLAARLLRRLGRALSALHAADQAHGGLSSDTILLDELGHPTILLSGIPPLGQAPTASDDVAAIIRAVAMAVGVEDWCGDDLNNLLIQSLLGAQREASNRPSLNNAPLEIGDDLYRQVETLELTLLRQKFALSPFHER